jgi:hypothetical protein
VTAKRKQWLLEVAAADAERPQIMGAQSHALAPLLLQEGPDRPDVRGPDRLDFLDPDDPDAPLEDLDRGTRGTLDRRSQGSRSACQKFDAMRRATDRLYLRRLGPRDREGRSRRIPARPWRTCR